jgi:(heptosyl)LPS beta-1,4-glucosyltransferase
MARPTVSAVILAHDEVDLIEGCVSSVAWADERIVVDDTTTARIGPLAQAAGAQVFARPWQGFPRQRNAALGLASGEWVLFVDADERVPPSLAREVRARVAEASQIAGFWVPRRNVIAGEWVRYAGWWPDTQLRLLRRDGASYDEGAVVHEVAMLDGPSDTLREPLLHLNYATLAELRAKQATYADLEARTLWERGIRARPHNLVLQPLREFRRRTVELGGLLQGGMGLRLGLEMALASYLTYRELLRLTRAERADPAQAVRPARSSSALPDPTTADVPVR